MKNILSLLLIGFVMISCDPAIGYEYHLDNQSDSVLVITFRENGFDKTNDPIIYIQPKSEMMFFDTEMMGKNPHDEKEEFLNVFDTLVISTQNMTSIKKDILKRENWTYDNDISHIGLIKTGTNIYKLKLTNEDL